MEIASQDCFELYYLSAQVLFANPSLYHLVPYQAANCTRTQPIGVIEILEYSCSFLTASPSSHLYDSSPTASINHTPTTPISREELNPSSSSAWDESYSKSHMRAAKKLPQALLGGKCRKKKKITKVPKYAETYHRLYV